MTDTHHACRYRQEVSAIMVNTSVVTPLKQQSLVAGTLTAIGSIFGLPLP
ncbi:MULTISPECIES: hypothetical protein [unclassified Erwinia]|nr:MULTISPECIES: hypothetical protein [unclassified Erwinia]